MIQIYPVRSECGPSNFSSPCTRKRKSSAVSAQPDSEFRLAPKVDIKDPKKTCPICQTVFKRRFSCKTHIAAVHGEKREYECYECSNKFKAKSTLSRHIKGMHMDKKPFNCKFCQRGFTRKCTLLKHESKCSKTEIE